MGRGLDGFFLYPEWGTWYLVALCSFEGPPVGRALTICGGSGEGETPLPIPNRVVKPLSADGTWPSRARESRTPPLYFTRTSRPGAARRRCSPARHTCDDADAMVQDVLDSFLAFLGIASIGVLIWLVSKPNREREDEDAARAYFDAHGRWPDDPAP
jgi:hypothetical protein